jgi:WD40 repeat protein
VSGAIIGTARAHKHPTSMLLTTVKDATILLISDKGGEVWGFNVPKMSRQIRLLGHTASIITALGMSPLGDFIVTSDRDEKVRVSRFPQTECIHQYCLGHKSVVTSIAFLESKRPDGRLLSCGWDGCLKLWNSSMGALLDEVQLQSGVAAEQPSTAAAATSNAQLAAADAEEGPDDEDVDLEKHYDASLAGNFPLKVVTRPLQGHSTGEPTEHVVAVAFWALPCVRLFRITDSSVSSSFHLSSGQLWCRDIALLAPPADVSLHYDPLSSKLYLMCVLTGTAADASSSTVSVFEIDSTDGDARLVDLATDSSVTVALINRAVAELRVGGE